LKVLFVTGEFPPMQGGVGDYTREIGLALRDLGCDVHVVTSAGAGQVPGLTVHPLVERWDWGCWRQLLDLVRRERPSVVHIQYQAAAYGMHASINFFPSRLRRMGGQRPWVAVTFHDLKVPYLFPKAGRVRRWVVEELARRSDAAITTNREDYESLRTGLRRPPALIPIGSNIAPRLPTGYDREAWRTRWGAGPDDLLLSFFGFVNARKGVDTLLRAIGFLQYREPGLSSSPPSPLTGGASPRASETRVRLVMIGGQTGSSDPTNVAYLAQIQELIGELGLGDRVSWTGYLPAEEVSACLLAADLCVLPFRDGASFLHGTFHAALAHGVPILTTQPRVLLPELAHGENIYLAPCEDPPALARAIVELGHAPELRRRLGEGAKALAEQFRWAKIAADTLTLYRAMGAGI
jgi:glycosyltransferase involved in cell wall biosynthesis